MGGNDARKLRKTDDPAPKRDFCDLCEFVLIQMNPSVFSTLLSWTRRERAVRAGARGGLGAALPERSGTPDVSVSVVSQRAGAS